jgi:copper transport protein
MRKAVQRRGWLALVGLGALIALLWGRPAQAHALLVRSAPAAGAEVVLAPVTVDLWFSEPLEPAFSYAYLVDAAGNKFGEGATTVDPADAHHLTLTLAPTTTVPPGIYTVLYHTLSQADGHEWLGSFPLTVLNPDGSRPTGDPAAATTDDDGQLGDLPAPLKAVSRWFSLMGALLLTGVLAFQAIAGRQPAADDGLLAGLDRLARLLLVVGIGAVFIGGWLQVLGQMTLLGEPDSRGVASGATLNLYFQTRAGRFLVARQLVAAGLLFLTIVAAGLPAKARDVVRWLMFLLSVGLLATFALGSHAAAVAGSGWAILGDFIHLTAAALWLGGLIALALLLWQWYQQPAVDLLRLRQIVRRFSRLATLAVFVLVVTGLFSTLVQLPTLADLWRTTYGQLLLLKIALVLTALGLAWFNHRFVRTDGAAPTDPRFARRVWREAAVGVGIMIVVALLVQTPPPPAPLATAPPALWETILQADDLTIHLQIAPNQVGDNRYIAHLYHADNSSIGTVQLVRLAFSHQTAALGQASLDLTAQGGDFFAGAGAYQNRAGPWDLALYVRRRGLDDLLATTTVEVPPPVASAPRDPWQNPIATLPAELVLGGLVGAFLVVPLIWRYSRRFTPTVE